MPSSGVFALRWSGSVRSGLARLAPRICLAGTLAMASACATGWQVDTAVDPDFTPAEVTSVAVLPWFDWALGLGETRGAALHLAEALKREDRDIRVVLPDDASEAIAATGLAYEWALFLYDRREGLGGDSTVVMRIGDAVGADLLAHITLPDVFQHDGSEELGSAYTSVLVQLELFDARNGRLAWAGSSGATRAMDPLEAPLVQQPVQQALDAVIDAVPRLGARSAR